MCQDYWQTAHETDQQKTIVSGCLRPLTNVVLSSLCLEAQQLPCTKGGCSVFNSGERPIHLLAYCVTDSGNSAHIPSGRGLTGVWRWVCSIVRTQKTWKIAQAQPGKCTGEMAVECTVSTLCLQTLFEVIEDPKWTFIYMSPLIDSHYTSSLRLLKFLCNNPS